MTLRMLGLIVLLALAGRARASADAVQVVNDDAHFPEGPVWHAGRFYYVEYDRNTVMTWDGTRNAVFATLPKCGPSAVIARENGELLATCYDSGTIGRMSAAGKVLPPFTHDTAGQAFIGPNDFAPDAHGGIYFTASGPQGPAIGGKVFYISSAGTITQRAADLHNANGIVVSRDGRTLYVIETEENRLLKFAIAADGSLSGRSVFLNLDELTHHVGHIWPDGVKIDTHGDLYIGQTPRDPAAPLAGTIFVVNPEGQLLRTVSLPSPGVPNFAFSPDDKLLLVTAVDQLDQSPYRGKVYTVPNR